jgi:hypothetical protein
MIIDVSSSKTYASKTNPGGGSEDEAKCDEADDDATDPGFTILAW